MPSKVAKRIGKDCGGIKGKDKVTKVTSTWKGYRESHMCYMDPVPLMLTINAY